MIKLVLGAIALVSVAVPAGAQVHVKGYIRKDGTYVAPSVRTAPNHTRADNYSSEPNYNPYNGKVGTVDPYQPKTPRFEPYQPYKAPCYYNCTK